MSEVSASLPPTSSEETEGAHRPRIVVLVTLLIVLVAAAYANAVSNGFVYDDLPLVLKNPEIRSLSNIPQMVGITAQGLELRARWTRMVTHALEYNAAGTWAPLYHLNNIVLHALVVWILFALWLALCKDAWVAFWAAAIFAVHPLNTEVVAHIAGRRDLLAAFFGLGGILLMLRHGQIGGAWRLVAALGAFYLAAFSKEVALLAPAVWVVIDLYKRYMAAREHASRRNWIAQAVCERGVLYAVLAVFSVGMGSVLLISSEKSIGLSGSPGFYETAGSGLSLLERLRVIGLGLRLAIFPVGQSVDYSFDALNLEGTGWSALAFVDLTLLAAGLALTAWAIYRRRLGGLAGLWFVLFYLPHAGLVSWHETFAERFLYLPIAGLCLALAWFGVMQARRLGQMGTPAWVAGAVVVSLLGFGTVQRNTVWESSRTLWQSAVERYPNCARAQKAHADVLLADGMPDLALEGYQRAVQILPRYRDAHVGVAVAQTARLKLNDALATLEDILAQWPNEPKAWNLRGYILQTMGRNDEALEAYRRSVECDPLFADGYNNMALLYVERGDVPTAIKMYHRALEHDPSLVVALRNLAIIYREGYGDAELARHYEARAERLSQKR